MGQLALCLLFGAFIAGAIVFVTPAHSVLVAKQVLVRAMLLLLALSLVYGVVHGFRSWLRRGHVPRIPALIPQTDLAILNWRREKSVFLGTDAPQEDASWRSSCARPSSNGRNRVTSEPRPWNRLAARLFDDAIWDSCSRCCCRNCTVPAPSATMPPSGSAIRYSRPC